MEEENKLVTIDMLVNKVKEYDEDPKDLDLIMRAYEYAERKILDKRGLVVMIIFNIL